MNPFPTFQEFLRTEEARIPLGEFALNLLLTALLCYALGRLYVRHGQAISNRTAFARQFVVLGMTTMLIISIVKSSLALSLGLVGALSIIRFRTAIKEPEELVFLFLCIAVGLGLGAQQTAVTLIAFALISIVIWLRHLGRESEQTHNFFFTVSRQGEEKLDLTSVVGIVKQYCASADLKRVDENEDAFEAAFLIECKDVESLERMTEALRDGREGVRVTYLDHRGDG